MKRVSSGWAILSNPAPAAPGIEALLPRLNEKIIDGVIPYLEQLKAK